VSAAFAQPAGIVDPETATPKLEPGQTALTFTGAPVTLSSLKFVAKGYRTVAKLRRNAEAAKLLGSGWNATQTGLTMNGDGPATLNCSLPESAAGLVLEYTTDRDSTAPATLSLNGSSVALPTVEDRPYECLVRLRRDGGQVRLAGEPILNMWDVAGHAPGVVFDETHCEIDLSPGNDPLAAGEYRMHVSYVADPKRAANPSAPCYAKLYGLDLTQYDGYVISFKAEDARYFHAGLLDSNNFSWGGGSGKLEPDEWTSLAIPFVVHANYTTAGDGVLKLSQLTRLNGGASGRPQGSPVTGEYWVSGPVFYKGEPPQGVPVAKARPHSLCAINNLSPERRKPHCYEGDSIQAIQQQGDLVWLGTDHGLVKCSRAKPDVPLAKYGMAEGLVDDDVQCVYADGKDLWIGTTCGLSRFDGEKFQNFTSDEGLLPGPVMAITSNDKYVWLAMARGLARYDKSSGKLTARKGQGGWSPESTGGQGVPVQEGRGVYADSIALDSDGSVWHAAAGLAHSREDAREMSHYLGTTKRVLSVFPAEEGVWIASAQGIELVSRDDGEVSHSFGIGNRKGLALGRHDAFVTCAYAEKSGIWLGYSDGIGWFNPKEKRCYWSPNFSVSMGALVPQSIFADLRNVWVGTDNGLMVFPKSKALDPWSVLEYSAPTDIWAAGVNMDLDEPEACEDGRDAEAEAIQTVSLDEEGGSPGSPGALLLTFDFGKDADEKACLAQRFEIDMPDCNGIAFRAKTDALYKGAPREFFVDVHATAKVGQQTRRMTWRGAIKVDPKWSVFKIPFASMKLVEGSGQVGAITPGSLQLNGVDLCRSVADHHCPGDAGKLWLDRLEWASLRGGRA